MLAQIVADPSQSDAFLDAIAAAISSGDYKWAAVLGIVGLTALVRQFGPKIPGKVGLFLATSRGGAITALVLALVMALAPAIGGKAPWSPLLVKDALLLGFAAIGGWVGVRRIVGAAPPPVVPAP